VLLLLVLLLLLLLFVTLHQCNTTNNTTSTNTNNQQQHLQAQTFVTIFAQDTLSDFVALAPRLLWPALIVGDGDHEPADRQGEQREGTVLMPDGQSFCRRVF
jgi:hypothetical protein